MAGNKFDMVIRGGKVIDPEFGFGKDATILINEGKIAGVEIESAELKTQIENLPEDKIVDASGKLVVPGLVDIHVHLREPGREDEETVVSGCRAAAAGGFTTICCMPNTTPRIDSQEAVKFVQDRAKDADARVFVVGAITKNIEGKELAEIGDLVKVGAVAITDDGNYVQNPEIMRRAMEYSRMFDIPVMEHAEDQFLTVGSVMNESFQSTRLGLPGTPSVAEEIAVLRDIALSRLTGARIHIQHVSCKEAVEAIRTAKKEGLRVTGEATPHHMILTDEEIGKEYNTNLRVNPPLRSARDRDAVIKGLIDGTLDCIASDHAPHSAEEKDCEFDQAPPGMIGLETTLGLIKTFLIDKGLLSWADAIRKMTISPAKILDLKGGTLAVGAEADITIIDPDKQWTVDPKKFYSLSRNTPFGGYKLSAQVYKTVLGGRIVFER